MGELPARALVTLGALPNEGLPERRNVHVVQSAPHSAVFPHARAVVTHAGHGTLIKSLAAGLPVVCLPLGRDQADNAVRAETRGAGVRVKPTASAAVIRRAIDRALSDPALASAAARLARDIRSDVARARGAWELESLVATSPSREIADSAAPPPS